MLRKWVGEDGSKHGVQVADDT